MTIPASQPRVYTSSKQLIGGDDFNNVVNQLNSFQSLTPAGATQATATPINAANVELLTAGAAGAALPVSFPGLIVNVLNNSGNTQSIYPNGNDQIQSSPTAFNAAGTAVTQASGLASTYICMKKGFWVIGKSTGP